MIRKAISIFFLCLGAFFFVVLLLQFAFSYVSKKDKTQTLSTRSKEFIQKQKELGNSQYATADFDTPAQTPRNTKQTYTTPCYAILVPFLLQDERIHAEKGPCVFEGRIQSPPARLVIGAVVYNGLFQEYTGILHRKRNPDIYSSIPIEYTNDQVQEVLAYSEAEGITLFAFARPYIVTIAITNMSQVELLKNSAVQLMVNSLEVKVPKTTE